MLRCFRLLRGHRRSRLHEDLPRSPSDGAAGHLQAPVIGTAKSDWTIEQFRAHARVRVEKHGGLDEADITKAQ